MYDSVLKPSLYLGNRLQIVGLWGVENTGGRSYWRAVWGRKNDPGTIISLRAQIFPPPLESVLGLMSSLRFCVCLVYSQTGVPRWPSGRL